MGNRNKERLAKLSSALKADVEEGVNLAHSPSGVRSLLQRDTTLSKIASGSQRTVKHFMHPPERIRLWSGHNRNYDLLSVQRCSDLIDGFTRTGRQEFPAIVRTASDDENFDYEVVCGGRRHWTAAHLGWPLLIEVRELNDRQAFILQDLENRDREDISDYERAVDYGHALPKFFDGNRAHMAQFLEIDKANFHRLLELADLPKAIVSAYEDIRDLKVHHGITYRKLLADPQTKRRLLDAARNIKNEQLAGSKVFAALKRVGRPEEKEQKSVQEKVYGDLSASRRAHDSVVKITLKLPKAAELSRAGIQHLVSSFESLVQDLRSGKL